jgi:hypothetical protein
MRARLAGLLFASARDRSEMRRIIREPIAKNVRGFAS